MKISVRRSPGSKPMAVCWVLSFLVSATRLATAAPLQEARVSQVIQDVRLLEAHGAPRPAVVNDKLTLERAVRTGKQSRAELTFTDLTITRLGANTVFSLKAGAREVDLTSGTVLLAVPTGAAPVKANTTAVTVAVTGGTALLATGPPTKFMVLEGIGTIYPKGHPEKAVTVHGGEMVVVTADGKMTQPEQFDVKLVLETSLLIIDFPPLPNLSLILDVAKQQLLEQQLFWITDQPLLRYLVDVIDVTDLNANANPILVPVRIGTPTPSPTPSKFGTPSTITSPNPYVITSGTLITTDPSITTNGVTDFGKIYRGPTQDGAFTLWAFGSTSAFDTALGIDAAFFAVPNDLPIATFKFQSLSLNGNPTIDLSNGGVTKLALIGVDGITSGPPGGTLTFTGLDLLALATVNGSINLTSDVSFQNLNVLAMYARGAGSNLILNSPISNIGILELAAEGSILLANPGTMSVGEFDATAGNNLMLQIGGSLLLNGQNHLDTLVLPGTTLASGANLTLDVTGDYTNSSATDSSRLRLRNEGAHIGTGGNINAHIGGNLTAMNDFNLVVQNTNGRIDNGGNITLMVDGGVSTQGQLSLLIDNSSGGQIGTGGNISVTTGGDLTAGSIDAFINNSNGGAIGGNALINFSLTGDLMTQGDASFQINNNPGTIGGDARINVSAANISTGGALEATIDNTGGNIRGNALINFSLAGNLMTQGDATFQIMNSDDTSPGTPGSIGGSATLNVHTGGDFTATSLFGFINDRHAGLIGGAATLHLDVGGALTTTNDFTWGISMRNDGSGGGTVGSNSAVNVSAASVSTGGFFQTFISTNGGGSITGNASNLVNVTRDLIVQGPVLVSIEDTGFNQINPINFIAGGHIGGNATVTLNARNITTSSTATGTPGIDTMALEASIYSNGSGIIGGNATVNVIASQNISAPGTVFFTVANGNYMGFGPGSIGGDAKVNVTAANLSTGALFDDIYNYGGASIGRDATISLNISNGFTATGNAEFLILSSGGTITRNASISASAANITANSLTASIDNTNGGVIGGSANLNFNLTGDLAATHGSAEFDIFNNNNGGSSGGTIGTDAIVNVNVGSLASGLDPNLNSLVVQIDDRGGSIGRNAIVNFAASGNVNAQGLANFLIDNADDSGSGGGAIVGDATVNVSAASITTGSSGAITTGPTLFELIHNSSGNIGGNASVNLTLSGDLTTTQSSSAFEITNDNENGTNGGVIGGDAITSVTVGGDINDGRFLSLVIFNEDNGNAGGGGSIGGNAMVNLSAANITTGNSVVGTIDNSGGNIGGSAIINFGVSGGGSVNARGNASFEISNAGGAIGDPETRLGDATISLSANNISTGGNLGAVIDNSGGGSIAGSAAINVGLSGNLTAGGVFAQIFNQTGSTIGSDARITMNTGNISSAGPIVEVISNDDATITGNAAINVTADAVTANVTDLNIGISNTSGTTGGDASISFDASGNINQTNGNTFFQILNNSGSIGTDATVNVNGANILTSDQLYVALDNTTGTVGGNAIIDFTAANNISANNAFFLIFNGGGTIGGGATISVMAANVTANSLLAQIDNTGGSIGGHAGINMNVSGSANVTNDATVAIFGSDGAGSAAINFNGGSYNAGGALLAYIDGNGRITFNNASAHADVLKAGVFGTNGVLNIGGGTLSADTELKLYAPGSSGRLNFVSNATLGGNSLKILAADSVTIFNNVVVTIGGRLPADVYTNHANYTGFGGNGTTTGTFAGAGANNPHPLSSAPPFDPASPATVRTHGSITNSRRTNGTPITTVKSPTLPTNSSTTRTKAADNTIHVSNTDQLLSLLDHTAPDPGGKITIPNSKRLTDSRNSSRLNADHVLKADSGAMDSRHPRVHSAAESRLGVGKRVL